MRDRQSEFDRTRFKQVVVMRGCSMCIDVGNFFRTDAYIFTAFVMARAAPAPSSAGEVM